MGTHSSWLQHQINQLTPRLLEKPTWRLRVQENQTYQGSYTAMYNHSDRGGDQPPGSHTTQPRRNSEINQKGRRFKKPPKPPSANSTINLSSKTLNADHLTLLDKGLTFCPTPTSNHPCHTLKDSLLFNRRLRLTHHILPPRESNTTTPSNPRPANSTVYDLIKPSSGWTPPPGKDLYVDSFIGNFTNHIIHLDYSLSLHSNLSDQEINALKDLQDDEDIVMNLLTKVVP